MGLLSRAQAELSLQEVADFVGAQLDGWLLLPPAYSDHGTLVDLVDGESLAAALARLDASKNRVITVLDLFGGTVLSNPNTLSGPWTADGDTITLRGEQYLDQHAVIYSNSVRGGAAATQTRSTESVEAALPLRPDWANAAILRCTAQVAGLLPTAMSVEPPADNSSGAYVEVSAGLPSRVGVVAAASYNWGGTPVMALAGLPEDHKFTNSCTIKVPITGSTVPVKMAWAGIHQGHGLVELVGYCVIDVA